MDNEKDTTTTIEDLEFQIAAQGQLLGQILGALTRIEKALANTDRNLVIWSGKANNPEAWVASPVGVLPATPASGTIRKKAPKREVLEIPPAFVPITTTIEAWVEFRKRKRFSPWLPETWQRCFAKWSPKDLKAAIEQSIEMEWQGIFPPKGQGRAAAVRVSKNTGESW